MVPILFDTRNMKYGNIQNKKGKKENNKQTNKTRKKKKNT